MIRKTLVLGVAAELLIAGCTVGPDYRRPEIPVPETFRNDPAPEQVLSFGDAAWWEVFRDEQLVELIHRALVQSFDLRVTAERILQARAEVTVAGSFRYPTMDAAALAPYDRFTGSDKPAVYETAVPQAGLALSWELDIWGKFARGTEAARAELLAQEEFQRIVVMSLVSDVARAYLELRALDLELEISRRTVASRDTYLSLTRTREQGGVATLLDVRQAEQLYYTATAVVADTERRVTQQENLIHLLLGEYPGDLPRGRPLTEQAFDPSVAAGLTVDLLARRPDVRQAEQLLIAANARIGQAEARLLPSVVLQGFGGIGAAIFNGNASGPLGVFSLLPSISMPIFNAGRLRAGVDFSEASAREALLRYHQTIVQAFREVADALVAVAKQREFREQSEATVGAQRSALQVANMRYDRGVTSFLEVLVTERDLFDAELALARAQRDEALSFVQLYRALGGGWQAPPPPDGGAEAAASAAEAGI